MTGKKKQAEVHFFFSAKQRKSKQIIEKKSCKSYCEFCVNALCTILTAFCQQKIESRHIMRQTENQTSGKQNRVHRLKEDKITNRRKKREMAIDDDTQFVEG